MLGLFGSARRQLVARAWSRTVPVAAATGVIYTLPRFGLLTPISYVKTGGSANLTVDALSGAISAELAIEEGDIQTISGTATGVDGVVIPWSATLASAPLAPDAPIINAIAGDDFIDASEAGATITGTSQPGATIALTLGGGNIRTFAADSAGAWSYVLQPADIAAMGQGNETISATQTTGGGTSAAATRAIVIDTIAPSISGMTLSGTGTQNNFLNAGDVVTVQVVLSRTVTVTGSPRVALDVGGTMRNATYLDGSDSNTLTFGYTVQPGDTDANGISIDADSLSLNGGSIIDSAGNPAVLTHGALSDQAAWKVDTTAPTTPGIALVAGIADGATHAEATAPAGVITASAETGSTINAAFTGTSGTVNKALTGTGSPIAVTLLEGDLTALGDGTVNVSVTATDPAGNTSPAATTSFTLEPDAPSDTVDLRFMDAPDRFEVGNAASFPSASYEFLDEDLGPLSITSDAFLARTATDKGVYCQIEGQPATRSALCFKGNAYTDKLDIDFSAIPNGTPVNTLGLSCDPGFYIADDKLWAPSKITSGIRRYTDGGSAPAVSSTPTSQSVRYYIENADLIIGNDYKSNRAAIVQRSANGDFDYVGVESRGQNAIIFYRTTAGGYGQTSGAVNFYDDGEGLSNGTLFTLDSKAIGGVMFIQSQVQKPARVAYRWNPADVGIGIDINTFGAVTFGNTIELAGVSSDYNGADYPLALYQNSLSFRTAAETAINVTGAIPVAPDVDNPVRLHMTGRSTLTGDHEACMVDVYGRQITDFQTFTLTDESFDYELLGTDDVLDAGIVNVISRKVGDPTSAVIHEGIAIPAWRAIERDFWLGVNIGAVQSSDPLLVRDLTKKMRWAYGSAEGYQLGTEDYPEDPGLPPLGPTGLPTGVITEEAWNWVDPHGEYGPARCILGTMIEGDDESEATSSIGGSVMPYGTAGQWTFVMDATPGDFDLVSGFAGAASPFSNFNFSGYTFTCDVAQNGPAGNVTTNFRLNPLQNGGKGVAYPDGIPMTFRKTGDVANEILLDSAITTFGREKLIRPLQATMNGGDWALPTYPYVPVHWADMDQFIELVRGFGPQARGWYTQPPLRTSAIIDPHACVLRNFEKMAVDREKLYSSTFLNTVIWEMGCENWNPTAPYGIWNAALTDIGNALGFFTGMPEGGAKIYAQRRAAAAWFAHVASAFFNEGTVPDLTGLGFPDLSHLANPTRALNGQVRTVFGLQASTQGYQAVSDIQSTFEAVGDVSGIWGLAGTTYIYIQEDDATLLAALDADDTAAAAIRILEMLDAGVTGFEGFLPAWSLATKVAFPGKELVCYEGRWHNNPNFSTSTRASRYLAAVAIVRASAAYKNIEKRALLAIINAGFKGIADYVALERVAEFTPGTTRQQFGILSDAGKFVDPATSASQMAMIARNEVHDLIESLP